VTGNPVFLGHVAAASVADFQTWERRVGSRMAARKQMIPLDVGFDLRDADVLDRHADVRLVDSLLVDARTGYRMPLDADPNLAVRIVSAIDGRSSYADVLSAIPESQREAAASWCHRCLGSVIVAPAAVDRLERRLPLPELVRFPQQSPYAVSRAYWENSIAVRGALPLLYRAAATSQAEFRNALRGLHRLATLGEDGRNFYGAASGLPTVPGELRQGPVRTWVTRPVLQTMTRWLDELGVREPLVASGAPAGTGDTPLIDLVDGGLTCEHLGGGDSLNSALEAVQQQVLTALAAREQNPHRALLASCARVHQVMVAVHPFANVNNSIAMNIVNDLLTSGGAGALPHLFLDYLALRMTPSGYAEAFAAVVAACAADFSVAPSRRRSVERCDGLLRLATLEHFPVGRSAGRIRPHA
jgi:hypothetical protein